MRKISLIFTFALIFLGVAQVKAETLTEGFEEISLTDANGNVLTSIYSFGYGLSNGWKVIGGTIYASAGTANYGLWTTAHEGSKSLEASYGSSNSASVVINQKLSGVFKFWARKTSTSSSTKGYITLYEAEENGDSWTVTTTALYSNNSLSTTWTEYTVDLGSEGKYVAINMIRAAIDDITYNTYMQAAGPALSVYDENNTKMSFNAPFDFGLTTPGATKTFTMKNPGTVDLDVTITTENGFTANPSEATIVAGGEQVVTVIMPEETASGALTIWPSEESGMANEFFTLQLSGEIKPVMEVYYNGSAVTDGFTDMFGKVKENVAHTYTVKNTGTKVLNLIITSDSEEFTVSEESLEIEAGNEATFDISFVYNENNIGTRNATIQLNPSTSDNNPVTINATAIVADPGTWNEDFEEGVVPTGWESTNWRISTFNGYENTTKMALAPTGSSAGTLITPRLEAKQGESLIWDAYLNWYDEALKVEYSSDDKNSWTEIYNYKTQDDSEAPSASTRNYHKVMTFVAPEDGYYYLRFTSTYSNGVDNFSGFKLALKEHDAQIVSTTIPVTGMESVEYTASVTVKETAGKEETLTATFFIGEAQMGETVTETVEANGEKTFTITFVPEEALSGNAYFVISNDDIELTTATTAVVISAIPTLDEAVGSLDDFENWGSYSAIKLKYNLKNGWNTIILPFEVNDLSIFGEGAKAWTFNGYENGNLKLSLVTSLNAQAPYIIYATEAKNEVVFTDVRNFRASTSLADLNITRDGVVFQGTYAPVAAPGMEGKYGVTSEGKIQKGSEKASIRGFRAYFENVPEGAKLSFEGIVNDDATAIDAAEVFGNQDGDIYDLSGRKVNHAQKGIYIQNGKKVVIK